MPRISDTIANLSAFSAGLAAIPTVSATRLNALTGFGSNPGALNAKTHVPDTLKPGAALVVVLHGCTQDAEGYDRGAGWSQLADEQGFAVLFPEQVRANNANLCFNWFQPDDTRRDRGEVASIHQMIEAMIAEHSLDRGRVFVTGLSAGGAMTSALLAAYPDVFASGAIIAGLPHGAAATMPEALAQMRNASASVANIQPASRHDGPWPTVSVWHGDADRVVHASNAVAIVVQWRRIHGVSETPARKERRDGITRQVWTNADGRDVIECYIVKNMGHGTPVGSTGPDGCGAAGPHMLEVGLSSTRSIARFWGIHDAPPRARATGLGPNDDSVSALPRATLRTEAQPLAGPGRIIEDALRAAGLMR